LAANPTLELPTSAKCAAPNGGSREAPPHLPFPEGKLISMAIVEILQIVVNP
jgi:hypothetical protein